MQQSRGDETTQRIRAVVTDPVAALGLDLEAVELSAAGKRSVLRVAIDKDGGITMDDVADATREVSRVLDESDVMGERAYTLEVTSRGVDRPLTEPRHWRRNRDRLVAVTPHEGEKLTGRITEAGESSATLDVDGTSREVAYDQVARAVVQVEFNRTSTSPGGDA
ncbi:ribosome maturation factor RimP [Nocardioides lentus]|uniref:Ribosome maturation factor RimP n=1 Tax=Nocardioides lentus TaxID=338077 RepID=A0ABN2PQ77_9ACTN